MRLDCKTFQLCTEQAYAVLCWLRTLVWCCCIVAVDSAVREVAVHSIPCLVHSSLENAVEQQALLATTGPMGPIERIA